MNVLGSPAELRVDGVPHAFTNRKHLALLAYLVLAPGEYGREQLARFKVPEEYLVVEALPKTSIGKIEKKALREQVAGERAMIEQSVSTGVAANAGGPTGGGAR